MLIGGRANDVVCFTVLRKSETKQPRKIMPWKQNQVLKRTAKRAGFFRIAGTLPGFFLFYVLADERIPGTSANVDPKLKHQSYQLVVSPSRKWSGRGTPTNY